MTVEILSIPDKTDLTTGKPVSKPKTTVSEPEMTVEILSIPDKTDSTTGKTVTEEKVSVTVSKEPVAVLDKTGKVSKDTLALKKEIVAPPKRTVSDPEMTVEILSIPDKTDSTTEKTVTEEKPSVTVSMETVTVFDKTRKDTLAIKKETQSKTKTTVSESEMTMEILSIPDKTDSTTQKTVTVEKESVPVSQETAAVLDKTGKDTKDTLEIKETVSKPKTTVSETVITVEILSIPTETDSTTEKTVTVEKASLSAKKDTVSASKTTFSEPEMTVEILSIPTETDTTPKKAVTVKQATFKTQGLVLNEGFEMTSQDTDTTSSALAPCQLGPSQDVLKSYWEWTVLPEEGSQLHPKGPPPASLAKDIDKQQLFTCQELGLELKEQRALLGDIVGHCGMTRPPCLSSDSQTHAGSHPEPIGGSAAQRERAILQSQLEEKLTAMDKLGKGILLQVAVRSQMELRKPESQAPAQSGEILTKHVPPSSAGDTGTQDTVFSSGGSWKEEQRGSVELLQGFSEQLQGLTSLVELGRERLVRSQQLLHSRAHLQTLLNGHKKFFRALGAHAAVLGHLRQRIPAAEQGRVQGAKAELEQDVRDLQLLAVEEGAQLQRTLEAWTQWDKSSSQVAELLQDMEAHLPSGGPPEEMERQLATYKELKGVLEENESRLYQALDLGRGLQSGGRCEGVDTALRRLETHWLAVRRRVVQGQVHAEEMVGLWSRFQQDSVMLCEWMAGARQRLQSWREQTATPPPKLLAELLELAKETEAMSSLKESVSRTGAQLEQLKGDDASGLQTQLEQLEQCWADLQAAQPVAREQLHKLLMEKLSVEEVMVELGGWMEGVEARLAEDRQRIQQASSTTTLSPLLQHCQECKVEMASHQLSLDFARQAVVQTSGKDVCVRRYERLNLAEQLGALHLRWLSLKGTLATQTRQLEQLQQICADGESRLLTLRSWITGQRKRMEDLPRPSSLSQAKRLVEECKDTEQTLKLKSAELQELRDSCQSGQGGEEQQSHRAFISQTDTVLQDFTAVSQQISLVHSALLEVVRQWEGIEGALGETALRTAKTSHALDLALIPQLSPQTLQGHIHRLQLLQEEVREGEEAWEDLIRTWSSLRSSVSPAAALLLSQRLEEDKTRGTDIFALRRAAVSQQVTEELLKAQALIELWAAYVRLSEPCLLQLCQCQDQLGALLSNPPQQDRELEGFQAKIKAVSELQAGMEDLHSSLGAVLEASNKLSGQMEPQASVFITSETLFLSQGVAQLARALPLRQKQLQGKLDLLQEYHRRLDSLEKYLKSFECKLESTSKHEQDLKVLQGDLLQMTAMTSALDRLNQLRCAVTLSSGVADRLQDLRTRWPLAFSRAMAMCHELHAEALVRQSFQQKCETCRCFLEDMEQSLPREDDARPSSDLLPQQLTIQRMLQVRVSMGCQILHSVITDGLDLLDRGQVEDRCGLIRKLAQQMERWQGTVQRAQQWGVWVQGLMGQRDVYASGWRMLRNLLSDTDHLLSSSGPALCSLPQLHQSLEEFKLVETQFQQHQGIYLQTLEAGRSLLPVQPQLQEELTALQEAWERTQGIVGQQRTHTEAVLQNWECCQTRLVDSRQRLEELKDRLNQLMPDLWEELQTTQKLTKEHEDALEDWSGGQAELTEKRADLACRVTADDITLLQAPEQGLRSQWEELRRKVSLREQETDDRLGAWSVFKENKKWLCDWLLQMESMVAYGTHLTSAEMAEKLNKDCMEDMKCVSENKAHLKELGEGLIIACDGAMATKIKGMLKDMEDQWERVSDCIMSREKQLQQRQERVQQLRRSLHGLQTQLSCAEGQLVTPLLYSVCHSDEIQKRLVEQHALEQDVERLSECMAPVIALCSARDTVSSRSDAENARVCESLERRWSYAHTLCTKRRNRIEETQRLWHEILNDLSRFEDWLKTAEKNTGAEEEVEKFEALQREVQEHFAQLELLNVQYQRLAWDNLTDTAGSLSVTVHEVNQRWDALWQQMEATNRKLKVVTEQPELSGQALGGGAVLVGGSGQEESESEEAGPPIQQAVARMLAIHGTMSVPGISVTEPTSKLSLESQQGATPGLGGLSSHTSTPSKQGYEEMMLECSGSIERVRKVSLILDDEDESAEVQGLTGLTTADKQSGVIQRWEVLQAQSPPARPRNQPQPSSDLQDVTVWLARVKPELERLQAPEPSASLSVQDMEARVKRLKKMQRTFDRYKGVVIALNLSGQKPQQTGVDVATEAGLRDMNQAWVMACILLDQWKEKLCRALMRCKEFHQTLHSMLLWLADAESRCLAVDVHDPALKPAALRERGRTLTALEQELQVRQRQVCSLQEISSQLLYEGVAEGGKVGTDSTETLEKLQVIGNKLQVLLRQVAQDRQVVQERLEQEGDAEATEAAGDSDMKRGPERRDPSPPRSFFARVWRAAFPLHLLLLLLIMLACLVPAWEEDNTCTWSNNFARSFYPMLHYTNGPPPT
ncbi:nesprin-2-like [Conger conger]|uniref:nesprin-2-like n=1 Tax=Conger conger TaxID=82655 RepID=UPI002A5AD6A0|nr:nesprin-2-like [Conger conger]